jgi:hypothetical protein
LVLGAVLLERIIDVFALGADLGQRDRARGGGMLLLLRSYGSDAEAVAASFHLYRGRLRIPPARRFPGHRSRDAVKAAGR